jgi:peptidoglycan/xylan/chitin deacetylase (PgdA/CDA1 family)
MSWEEVASMADSGLVSFGAHTVNHVLLDQIDDALLEREVEQSRRMVEAKTGKPCVLFAYPEGRSTPVARDVLRRHGFEGAVTTRRGWLDGKDDPFDLPRIGMHEDISRTRPLFAARLFFPGF